MKAFSICLLFQLVTYPLLAQSHFRPGYLIVSDGNRQEVDIFDQDWNDNPSSFRYRDATGTERIGDLTTVAEFGVPKRGMRYLRATVDVDRSEVKTAMLGSNPEPSLVRETVFLEVLVDGLADLFAYHDGDVHQFYLRKGEDAPRPLINRRYRDGEKIREQRSYRGQLRAGLDCHTDNERFQDLLYQSKDLVQLFTDYHECVGAEATVTVRPAPVGAFKLALRPGAEYRSGYVIAVNAFGSPTRYEYPAGVGLRLGVEGELTLPRANNRWALMSELFYSDFRSQGFNGLEFRYASLALSGGFRRYFFLDADKAVFLNAAGVVYAPLTDTFSFRRSESAPQYNYDITSNFGVVGGVGLRVRDKYWMEVRYDMQQDILQSYSQVSTRFSMLSVIAGYRLL